MSMRVIHGSGHSSRIQDNEIYFIVTWTSCQSSSSVLLPPLLPSLRLSSKMILSSLSLSQCGSGGGDHRFDCWDVIVAILVDILSLILVVVGAHHPQIRHCCWYMHMVFALAPWMAAAMTKGIERILEWIYMSRRHDRRCKWCMELTSQPWARNAIYVRRGHDVRLAGVIQGRERWYFRSVVRLWGVGKDADSSGRSADFLRELC